MLDGEVLMGYSATPATEHAPFDCSSAAVGRDWPEEDEADQLTSDEDASDERSRDGLRRGVLLGSPVC